MYLKDEGVKHRDCLRPLRAAVTDTATCSTAVISRRGVQAAEGKKQSEGESGVGEAAGSGASRGTAPAEPLRRNSANETLEQGG